MEEFNSAYEKLVLNDMDEQLPGKAVKKIEPISGDDVRNLIGYASLLSVSDEYTDQSLSYEIVTRLIEIKKTSDTQLLIASDFLLSRLGNFPGRKLLRERYLRGDLAGSPISFSLEKLARETENTIGENSGDDELLTDFQYLLYRAVTEGRSVSVSAPTSAGKSYVLNLALINRLESGEKESIIYVVPTKALINEVTQRIRESLRKSDLSGIVIRTAPFPVKKEDVSSGIIYILTQERLNSLLYSKDFGLWITSLIVDEAHEIQKRKRGIVLQNSIDSVLTKFPNIPVLFASPLISNPGYFLDLFLTGDDNKNFIERVSPVTQNIILVETVRGKTTRAQFTLSGREKAIHLGERELDFKYRGSKSTMKSLLSISLTRDDDSTIIFANGPGGAEKIASSLSDNLDEMIIDEEIESFVDFIKSEIHPEYPLVTSLPKGVAFHYGHMPSIVRSGVEALFKQGKIKYICCTSTLLQGVNLPAKNIVIDNPKSGDKYMSRPDFLNLSGRAGRLLKEFHGNIWCINPEEWDDSIYKGEQLEEICSAIDLVMKDGGSVIDNLFKGEIKKVDEIESAEIAFSRIYHELSQKDRDAMLDKYGLEDNLSNLDKTLNHCESLDITLPYSLLESHKSLRPDHLEAIYIKLKSEMFLPDMAPLHPRTKGYKARFESILTVISESFEWNIHAKYSPLLSYLACEWVRGASLGVMIANRVDFVRGKDPEEKVTPIIRDILKTIEHDIRFKLEKYFFAYNDVLKLVFVEKKIDPIKYKIEPYHIYLEFGASDKTSLMFMSLGLSRFTALRLAKFQTFKSIDNDKPEEYLRALSSLSLLGSELPRICLNEIHELVR